MSYKLSGSEPSRTTYYNSAPPLIRNNCMAYAFQERGKVDGYKQQPGDKSGFRGNVNLKNCTDIRRLILRDYPGLYAQNNPKIPCKKGFSKIMAFIAPNRDFHFYRMDNNGLWSHKRGLTKVMTKDACDKNITDPRRSCRKFDEELNYTMSCGTYCTKSKLKRKIKNRKDTNVTNTQKKQGKEKTNTNGKVQKQGAAKVRRSAPRPRRRQT